jgi:magnesium chelatase family protein
LDRIDIHLEVPAVKFRELANDERAEPSTAIRKRVSNARLRQIQRFKDDTKLYANAHMDTRDIRKYCPIDPASKSLLRTAILRLGLSARAYDRILKVARTIADLEGTPSIQQAHVAEAIQYRTLDRQAG